MGISDSNLQKKGCTIEIVHRYNNAMDENNNLKNIFQSMWPIAVSMAAAAITVAFLRSTPPGFFGKIDNIGSSVCHQIPSHAFRNESFQMPLCARCTGLYTGALIGLLLTRRSEKHHAFPKGFTLWFLVALFLLWAGDSLNSFISAFINRPFLYETTNLTRILSGLGMGLVMAVALRTLLAATVWKDGQSLPVLGSPRLLLAYFLCAAIAAGLLWTQETLVLKIFSIASIFSVVLVITTLYTVFWVLLFKRDNTFTNWKSLAKFGMLGYATAAAQIVLLADFRNLII